MKSCTPQDIHVFERNSIWLGFDKISNALFALDDRNGPVIAMFAQGQSRKTIASRLTRPLADIHNTLDTFLEELKVYREKQIYRDSNYAPRTLMLLVSQTCNMRCSYCYADSGTYGQDAPPVMPLEVALRALELAHELAITNIQFFGGEPLLAFMLIKQIVAYAEEKGYSFRFGVITNGTCVNDEVADFFRQHQFSVTISIDGPKDINDICRRFPNGDGTFDAIIKGIERLNERRVPLSLETVYGRRHAVIAPIGRALAELLPYCKSYIVGAVIPYGAACSEGIDVFDEEDLAKVLMGIVDFMFDQTANGVPWREVSLVNMIQSLYDEVRVRKHHICGSLATRLTVFSNGDVYSCQMCNQPQNCFGNVMETSLESILSRRNDVLSGFTSDHLNNWYDGLCDTCIALLDKDESGHFRMRYAQAYDAFFEHFLYRVATADIDRLAECWRDAVERTERLQKTS